MPNTSSRRGSQAGSRPGSRGPSRKTPDPEDKGGAINEYEDHVCCHNGIRVKRSISQDSSAQESKLRTQRVGASEESTSSLNQNQWEQQRLSRRIDKSSPHQAPLQNEST